MILDLRSRAQRFPQSLWTVVAAPAVWAVHFLFCYVYTAIRCAKGGRAELLGDVRLAIAVGTIVALAIVVALGYIAWVHSQTEGDPPPHDESTDVDRLRFLAVATLLLTGLSVVAIVFTALPAFILDDCR